MKLHRRNGLVPQSLILCLSALLLGLVVLSTGCGGSGLNLTPPPTPTPAPLGKLYISNESANAIVRFDSALTATGDLAPSATIMGPTTQLTSPEHILLDTAADRLFVANLGASSILVFDQISTKNGDTAPNRVITGAATNLINPVDLAYDKTRDMLYVADGLDILVFNSASTANGDVASARDILPGFSVSAIFLDSGDRLYAADAANNAINVYDGASTLNNAATANRVLSGASTSLSQPAGILVDSAGRLIVSNAGANAITTYNNASVVNGNVAPSTAIVGVATKLNFPSQMALNPASTAGELYVTNSFSGEIPVFAGYAAANGNVGPTRDIAGPATTLTSSGTTATARGIALDSTR
jgi:hypothetical protein